MRVDPSLSPAMDIQLPSNFERLLYEVCAHKSDDLRQWLNKLEHDKKITFPKEVIDAIRQDFDAAAISDAQTLATIKQHYQATNTILDPHSAVGLAVAEQMGLAPCVVLSTAHASKFPEAVHAALGKAIEPPAIEGESSLTKLPNDRRAISAFMQAHSQVIG